MVGSVPEIRLEIGASVCSERVNVSDCMAMLSDSSVMLAACCLLLLLPLLLMSITAKLLCLRSCYYCNRQQNAVPAYSSFPE